jgi:hypothetical protein
MRVPRKALECYRQPAGTSVSRRSALAVYSGGVVALLVWQGVDVMSEDGKKIYILVERAGGLTRGVSRALWPATVRRMVATGKAAQRRRARLMKRQRRQRLLQRFAQLSPRLFLPALVASSMLCGSALVLALVWQLWYLPVMALLPLLLLSCSPALRRMPALPPVPLSQQTILDTAPIPPSFPWKSLPGQIGSPETPMPDPPSLVRVLETFDLSRAESEPAPTRVAGGHSDPPTTCGGADPARRASAFPSASPPPDLPDSRVANGPPDADDQRGDAWEKAPEGR